jgi:O-antigen/teichoic acid export membrane protein
MMTYHRIDAIMLERMVPNGAVQAGWYAMGYRLFEAANMIGFLFATLLLPYFTRMLSTGEDVRPLAAGVSRLLLVGGGSVAWVAAFFAPAFLGLFYTSFLNEAAPILPWLMTSFAVFAQGYVYSTLLTARGDLRLLNLLAALGAVANIAGNAWWLSQADGSNAALGCAVISAGTQVLVVGLQTGFAMRFHPGRIWWKVLQTGLLHSLACVAICWAFMRLTSASGWSVIACLICCIAAGALPGIVQTNTLRQLLSEKMNTFADS